MLRKWFLIFSLMLSLGLVWAQGSEDFTNTTATASYADGSFVGNGGVTWTFGHSRNEDIYPIDGNGLMLRRASDSYLQATIPGGIGNFSFQYRKAYTGTSARQLELYVNDVVVGTTEAFGTITGAEPTIYDFIVNNINATGNVTIKIKNVGSTTTNRQTVVDNIVWTGFASAVPMIYVNGILNEFSTFQGSPSESQSYSLTGENLSGNISITAPTGFQVSLDNITFASSANVASNYSDMIYVRLTGDSVGPFSGDIVHSSTGAENVTFAVSGTVNPADPTIVLSGTLNNFNTTPGTPSSAQNYIVEGIYLTGNITVTPPAGYEVSLIQSEGYTGTLQLTHASGIVAPTTVYARLTGAVAGSYSGEITHTSTGAVTQNMAVSGNVATAPTATVLLRPAQISIADAAHESAVLVQVENYPSDDARYRLYNGSNQYNPWNQEANEGAGGWVTSTSFSSGPKIPGTPSSSVSWWIPFQRGNNNSTLASYRDRLGSSYSVTHQTAALPAATAITTAVPIVMSQVAFSTWSDYVAKHVVLAYDATETLIAAASTEIGSGAFTVLVEQGTTITRIEVRDVMNNLLEAVTGTWPQVLNPQIILTGEVDPLGNIAGNPSEELGFYHVQGQDLTADISVLAPEHFEIATATEGPWSSTLSLSPAFNGTIYVRMNSSVEGAHVGDITHTSTGATAATIRVEGETFAPFGLINVTSTMTPFVQETGTPSPNQSYSLSGSDLSGTIGISTTAPFELSENGSTGWATQINVAASYNGLIYVRLNSLTVGTFTDVEILHENENALPVSILVSGTTDVAAGPVHNLFFSEYIEGASNNKALEIYNASGENVDLSRYKVELYSNGSATPGNTLLLSGTLAPGAVYVIANSGAVAEILALADVTSTVTYFNGDDAIALRCMNPDTLMDVIGEIGLDPGTAWPVAGVAGATLDHTLVRKPTVTTGDTSWLAQQGTDAASSQWIVFDLGTHQYLGSHDYNPGGLVTEAPVFDPPAGTYLAPVDVTITSGTPGAAIRYTTDGTDPTPTTGIIYSGDITVSETTTFKAIAYAAGYDPSFVITAVYSMPVEISDIATLRGMPTGSTNVYKLTGEAVLTYQNATRNTKYIQDATAAIVIDDPTAKITTTYNLYDGITGITGTLGIYNGLLQFTPVADPGAATSSNNVVVPEVRTLASLVSADQGKLIKVMDVDITHATLVDFPATAQNLTATDVTASLTLRTFVGTDYANTPIPTESVNLTCLVGQYNTGMQVSPRFLSDIETTGGTLDTPMVQIALNGSNVDLTWAPIAGASSYRIESADDPYGTYSLVTTTVNPYHSVAASSAKKFYRVIALP